MGQAIVTARAEWDDEAQVWSIWSDDVPGLNIEAERFEDSGPKASVAIGDLAQDDRGIAALAGRLLDIHAVQHAGRLAFV